MPLYGFECKSCGEVFETLVRSGEKASCPSCESTKLNQMLSRIARPRTGGAALATAEADSSSSYSSSSDSAACAMPSSGHGGGCDCC